MSLHSGDCRNGFSLRERIRARTSKQAQELRGGKWAGKDTPLCPISLSGSVFVLPDSGGK